MRKRMTTVAAVIAVGAVCLTGLSGCLGSKHEIIGMDKACESCHGEKQTYEVSSPKDALTCGTTLTVETKASTVVVCKPIFISEDGSSYVPERYTQQTVRDGSVTLTLEEGTWAICSAEDSKISAEKIVQVTAGVEEATIQL